MPDSTPKQRNTRSNSNPSQNITLNDIKALIDSSNSQLATNMKQEIQKLSDMITPLLNKIAILEKQNVVLQQKVNELERREVLSATCMDSAKNCDVIIREAEERLRRRDYLVISGLPERTNGSITDREQYDRRSLTDLTRTLNVLGFQPIEVERIGKISNTRPRLLRVKCESKETKVAILSAARNLRHNESFKRVYINPDLTWMQRENRRRLRADLEARRERGEDVYIRGGQIIQKDQENFH